METPGIDVMEAEEMIMGGWLQEFPIAVLGNSMSSQRILPVVGRALVFSSVIGLSLEVMPCRVGVVVRLVSVELGGEKEDVGSLKGFVSKAGENRTKMLPHS